MDAIAAVLRSFVDVLGAVGSSRSTGSTGSNRPAVAIGSSDVTFQSGADDGLAMLVDPDDGDEVLLGLTHATLESSSR